MELLDRLISHLFPSRCILCRQTVSGSGLAQLAASTHIEICAACFAKLPVNDSYCISCALPLPDHSQGVMCGRCIVKPPAFDYCFSPFRYQDEIIFLVHQLKFSAKIAFARSLGELLFLRLQAELQQTQERPDCLLPVPLHNRRLRQRGFNQSTEIARVIAGKLKIPIAYDLLRRQRHTEAQSGLNAKQRRKNISNAFRVNEKIRYTHVLIVDDVVTTAATVNEIARLLKKNGVRRVGVLSIARAPFKS